VPRCEVVCGEELRQQLVHVRGRLLVCATSILSLSRRVALHLLVVWQIEVGSAELLVYQLHAHHIFLAQNCAAVLVLLETVVASGEHFPSEGLRHHAVTLPRGGLRQYSRAHRRLIARRVRRVRLRNLLQAR